MIFNGFTQNFKLTPLLDMKYTFFKKLKFSCILLLISAINLSAQDAQPDLVNATILCDKRPITIASFNGPGDNNKEADTGCLQNLTETNTSWFTWQAGGDPFEQQLLNFTIAPNQAGDQFGFVLFQLPNGLNNETGKGVLRCAFPCQTGAVGLRPGENNDIIREDECVTAPNGFMRSLQMTPGNFYGLMVENTTPGNSDNGFTITFSGNGQFIGPVGEITPDESAVCFGEAINFTNDVTFANGNLTRYDWVFEDGEDISTQTTQVDMPQDFTFQSNGTKRVELTVTTNIGCTAIFETFVTINDCCGSTNEITIEDNPTITEIACPDDTNGAIDITVSNAGTFPAIYTWDNGETTEDLSMLPPATYSVTVSNAAGCRDSFVHEFIIPNALEAMESVVNPSCGGLSDGSITIAASGGRMPYEYDFGDGNGFVATATLNGLDTGDYEVIVRDDSGCTKTIEAIELDEKQLNITVGIPVDPTCFGESDGSISITADNAVGVLTFDFNDGNGPLDENSINALGAGDYTIDVFDSENCTGNTVDFPLTEPDFLGLLVEGGRNGISCTGANDGTAIVTPNGGLPDYTYEWSTGSIERSISNLGPGTYTVTVTDANGCTAEGTTAPFVDPEVLTADIANIADVSCSDQINGSITLNVNGGTMPYKYTTDGITFVNGTTISNLSIGDYAITVTDNNDCAVEVNGTISSPANLSFDISSTTDICYGESLTFTNTSTFTQGNITTVSWNFDGVDVIGDNVTTNFTTIGKPTVSLTVTTDLGCTETLTEELDIAVIPCCDGNNGVFVIPDPINPLCNGGLDGSIALNITSTPPVSTINWEGGATEPTINNLAAGDYPVTITNDATCDAELTVTIGEPSLIIPILIITEPTCDAASNGIITTSATGGTVIDSNNYNFDFNFGDGFTATNTATNLSVGDYNNIRIRDDNNCIVSVDTLLAVPAGFSPITASLAITTPTCDVATNGTITVSATGDGRPLFYDFGNGPSIENTLPNLGVGPQTIIVQDLDNCTVNLDTTLTVAPDAMPIQASVQITQPSCTEANNGVITITATGNGSPFLYDFGDGFSNSNSAMDLIIGDYPVVIRDADNCSLTIDTSLSVSPDASPVQATLQIVQPSCGGATDGSVTILPSGELGTDITNYTYDFGAGFINNNIADNLGNGQFFAVVRNTNNCSIVLDTMLNELVLTPTHIVARPTCFGLSDGSIIIEVPTPGEGPFTYNFGDVNGFQPEDALTNLPEGNYTVQVQDVNLCLSEPIDILIDQPDALMLSLNKTDISCFGENDGRIVADVTGGVGNYAYNWNNGQMSSVAGNLMAGDYTLDVTDGNDCPISSDNAITIIEPAELSATIDQIANVLCFGETNGAITVNPMGGSAPYEYSLDGIIFQPTATLGNLTAGDYTVTIKDSRECEISTANATVEEPGEFTVNAIVNNPETDLGFTINLLAEANTTATGGINYTWSTPDSIVCTNCERFETVPPGSTTYTVTAVNSDNCQATASVSVAVSTNRPIYFPNIFTPNGDGIHDEFYIPFSPAMTEIKEFKIYDRSGALVYEAFNIKRGEEINKAWDGEFNGTKIRQGVFVVTAQISFVDNQTLPYQSDITLITSK